jgi:hypothetical protein
VGRHGGGVGAKLGEQVIVTSSEPELISHAPVRGAPGLVRERQRIVEDQQLDHAADKPIEREVVVIPKSVRADRMAENVDVFGFTLDDEMNRIAALDTGESLFFDHRDHTMVSRLGNDRVD